MSATIHPLGRMTEDQYKQARQKIEETCLVGVEAKARKEQQLAELMYRSGWTHQRLAEIENRSRSFITYMLQFGRFLAFVTNSHQMKTPPKNLTESRFRGYWRQTEGPQKGNERKRLIEVAHMIENDLQIVNRSKNDSVKINAGIIEHFGNGKWHKSETIAKHMGLSETDANNLLRNLISNKRKGIHTERRKHGNGWQYRIVKGGHQIDLDVLRKEISPFLETLKEEGKCNTATINPGGVLRAAIMIERLLEKLAK